MAKSRIVDSFNTYRRMPRWRDVAIIAGSVAKIKLSGVTAQNIGQVHDRLAALERGGIGWRRHEGFGRIAFNHPLFTAFHAEGHRMPSHQTPDVSNKYSETMAINWANWKSQVDDWGEKHTIKPYHEAIARMLHINRFASYSQLMTWFAANAKWGDADYLWGKKTRTKASLVEETMITSIRALIESENLKDVSAAERADAIGYLADLIADRATNAKREDGT